MAKNETGRGTWDGRTRGRRDVGLRDAATRGRRMRELGDAGTRGLDKQTTPEFAIYNFRWSRERYHIMESLPVADDFQRPWST